MIRASEWGKAVILVLVDGLRFDTATSQMGFLEGMVAEGLARRWCLWSALPSLSRPLYHTLHTGLTPQRHGILANETVRASTHDSVFSLVAAAGGRTAAAAYSWFSELYNGPPYDPILDREVDHDPLRVVAPFSPGPGSDPAAGPIPAIHHGRFYTEDDTPDREVINTGAMLARRFRPDYLLVHVMGCDHLGHRHGGQSAPYRRQAARIDAALSLVVPDWLAAGQCVAVTADHGMNADGWHGGPGPEDRRVPFYLLGASTAVEDRGCSGSQTGAVSQLAVAPTLVTLLGLPIPPSMTVAPLVVMEPTQ